MPGIPIQKVPPVVRWIYRLVGIVVLLVMPAFGAKVAIEQHHVQGPSTNSRGQHSRGYEVRGPAAIAMGIGMVGIGLSIGYGLAFRLTGTTPFKANRLDRVVLALFLCGLVCLLLSGLLPTRIDK